LHPQAVPASNGIMIILPDHRTIIMVNSHQITTKHCINYF
jgi:hypothetical protein